MLLAFFYVQKAEWRWKYTKKGGEENEKENP